MQRVDVDSLAFFFPDDWSVSKYDDWSFYRNRWSRIRNDIKAVDLLGCSPDGTIWFVEVKDYRRHRRAKTLDLVVEIAQKVHDTLAALLPAKINGDDALEQAFAARVLRAIELRVVLHLEQPAKPSKLHPRAIDPAAVLQKLRQMLKPVDAHPIVCETTRMGTLPWTVQ